MRRRSAGPPDGPGRRPDERRGSEPIYIAWIDFQRRVASMEQILGFEVHYVPSPFITQWLKPLGYLAQALRTVAHPARRRPGRGLGAVAARPSCRTCCWRCVGLIAAASASSSTATTASLDPALVALARHGLGDEPLRRRAGAQRRDAPAGRGARRRGRRRSGCSRIRPPLLDPPAAPSPAEAAPYVLVPCSFGPDEPIPVLLAAARLLPEVALPRSPAAGARPRRSASPRDAPANVRFTDYLPIEEFERLLVGAGGGARRSPAGEGSPAQRRQRGARRASRAGALGHPHPARDVRRGGALRAEHPRGHRRPPCARRWRAATIARAQRRAQGPPAGQLAPRRSGGGSNGPLTCRQRERSAHGDARLHRCGCQTK